MFQSKGLRFWFIVFSIQIFIGAVVPTAVLLLLPPSNIGYNIDVGGMRLEKVNTDTAAQQINKHFEHLVQTGEIIMTSEGEQITIPFSSVELQMDSSDITDILKTGLYHNRYFEILDKPIRQLDNLAPRYYFNEARLKELLTGYSDLFVQQPSNATLTVSDNLVQVIPHQNGIRLNEYKTFEYIKSWLTKNPLENPIISQEETPDLFELMQPAITIEALEKATKIYQTISISVPDAFAEDVSKLVQTTATTFLLPDQTFSFRNSITTDDGIVQEFLASHIYRAILPMQELKVTWRKQANQPITGIEPGFEVSLEQGGDLLFHNTSESVLAFVFTKDKSGQWAVNLVGQEGLTVGEIKTEQRKIPPSVIYSQDGTLPEKVYQVVEAGREGISVHVSRIVQGAQTQLYEDYYQPIHKIVAIGTGIKKEEIIRK